METSNYLKAIIDLMPNYSIARIVTTDDYFEKKIPHTSFQREENSIIVVLNPENKENLSIAVNEKNIEDYIERIEIRLNGGLLFEGYDSMEYGIISKKIELNKEFIINYIKGDMCEVSESW